MSDMAIRYVSETDVSLRTWSWASPTLDEADRRLMGHLESLEHYFDERILEIQEAAREAQQARLRSLDQDDENPGPVVMEDVVGAVGSEDPQPLTGVVSLVAESIPLPVDVDGGMEMDVHPVPLEDREDWEEDDDDGSTVFSDASSVTLEPDEIGDRDTLWVASIASIAVA
jgi:hypothetical protein